MSHVVPRFKQIAVSGINPHGSGLHRDVLYGLDENGRVWRLDVWTGYQWEQVTTDAEHAARIEGLSDEAQGLREQTPAMTRQDRKASEEEVPHGDD